MNVSEMSVPGIESLDTLAIPRKLKLDMFTLYLLMHSVRKYNFIYWNVNPTPSPILCFCNTAPDKITRINDPKLCFRLVKVQDRKAWKLLSVIIGGIFLNGCNRRDLCVVRVDYLMQYLKSIQFDYRKIEYTISEFDTRIVIVKDKEKPVVQIAYDIHCQYLMDRLYKTYITYVEMENEEVVAIDVRDEFDDNPKVFDHTTLDGKLTMEIVDGLDIASLKLRKYLSAIAVKWGMTQCQIDSDIVTVINRLHAANIVVVSVRVYLNYFLKAIRASEQKKAQRKTHEHKD